MARIILAVAKCHFHQTVTEEDISIAHSIISKMYAQRGLKTGMADTYVDRISNKIKTILAETKLPLLDIEIYDKLLENYPADAEKIKLDVGTEGPSRTRNKRWRAIMESVERSMMIEIQQKNPRKIQWKQDQSTLEGHF